MVRLAAIALTVALFAGCGSFGESAPPSATTGPEAGVDAAGDGGADAGTPVLPSPADCVNGGTVLAEASFDALPPPGWSKTDPAGLLTLDTDVEDVVSAPSSFRAGVKAGSSALAGLIQRAVEQSLAGTICITFQGRLDMGTEPFGTTDKDYAALFGVELQTRAGSQGKRSIGLAIEGSGLRLHVKSPTEEQVTPQGIPFGDDITYQRWTLVIGRAARAVAFWIGPNRIDLPLDLPFDPELATFTFGVATSGTVPAVTFHVDDLRIALLP